MGKVVAAIPKVMLDKIHFENYKLFKEKQTLELRPITVLIGKNNAGKSSVTKLPTLIENSLSGDFPEAVLLENDGVVLGTEFKDLVHGRSRTGILEIGLETKNESLNLKIGAETSPSSAPIILSWKYIDKDVKLKNGKVTEYRDKHEFMGFLPQDKEAPNLKDLALYTDYIGPFRELPKRLYKRPLTSKIEKSGNQGEQSYAFLIQDSLTSEKKLLKEISDWTAKYFNGWGLQVNADKAPDHQIELVRDNGKLRINLADAGQGIGQALPLIIRAFKQSAQETLIIIEQPELHLHPAAHGDMAELFVNSLVDRNKKYLIETHSQNFVLRLRRLVAEKKLDKDDLAIYFVDFDEEKSVSNLERKQVDSKGNVSSWPKGVFSETLEETIAIRDAQLNY